MDEFFKYFVLLGVFISPYFRIDSGDKVIARHTLIDLVSEDTTITAFQYRDHGLEMNWHVENKTGQGDYTFRFSADSLRVLKGLRIRHEADSNGPETDTRFVFAYDRDTLLSKVRIFRNDTPSSEETYMRDARDRAVRISVRNLEVGRSGGNHEKTLDYDGADRLIRITLDSQKVTRIAYGSGNLIMHTSRVGLSGDSVELSTNLYYDAEGAMSRVEEFQEGALTSVDVFEYRKLEAILGIRRRAVSGQQAPLDRDWNNTVYAYDLLGRSAPSWKARAKGFAP